MPAQLNTERRAAYETLHSPEQVPLSGRIQRAGGPRTRPPKEAASVLYEDPAQLPWYDLVPIRGPQQEILEAYRGVQRRDTREIVSVVSSKYSLVQHRAVANAVHLIGAALEQPTADAGAPSFPREQIRLFAGGRRMEVRLVVGTRYDLGRGESVYPGVPGSADCSFA